MKSHQIVLDSPSDFLLSCHVNHCIEHFSLPHMQLVTAAGQVICHIWTYGSPLVCLHLFHFCHIHMPLLWNLKPRFHTRSMRNVNPIKWNTCKCINVIPHVWLCIRFANETKWTSPYSDSFELDCWILNFMTQAGFPKENRSEGVRKGMHIHLCGRTQIVYCN